MNLELLCAAVQEAPAYLDRFTRLEYADAFKAYTERFGPAYMEAARETGGDETALSALADALLDVLEAGWKKRRAWNRAAVRTVEKQAVVNYLSPMLLGLEEPLCLRLAETLRDRWAVRWPKDAYRTADYATIKSGFRYSILGIDMGNRYSDPEKDR